MRSNLPSELFRGINPKAMVLCQRRSVPQSSPAVLDVEMQFTFSLYATGSKTS